MNKDRYIAKSGNKWRILKKIGEVLKTFGYFHSKENSRSYRDYLEAINWTVSDNKLYNKYIRKTGGKYRINKNINGDITYFGSFDTLSEAREYRDFLVEHDWDLKYRKVRPRRPNNTELRYISYHKVDDYYRIQKVIDNHMTYFSSCKTLEEAIHERDFWESIDWDMDLLDLY